MIVLAPSKHYSQRSNVVTKDDGPSMGAPTGARDPAGAANPAGAGAADPARLQTMVEDHFDFIWRSIRRLGVPAPDVDDLAQQVFLVAAQRYGTIPTGRERAFLFGTALRVTGAVRRAFARRREVGVESDEVDEPADPSPSPEDLTDRERARAVADQILEAMPLELRAVLVLYEAEGMSTPAIAEFLGVPVGTVASRLRRAREDVQVRLKRVRARGGPL